MSTAENYLLGMDLGTTNVKAIIMDEDGNVIATSSETNRLIYPDVNMVEQDPDLWWNNSLKILRAVTAQAGEEVVRKIRGICISSQTVSLLPVDKEGRPLRNALIWMDGRSLEELHYIIDTIGFDRYVSIIGGQPSVGFLTSKLLWFKKHEPELFAKTEKILQASSYINFKLTGKMTMDIDQAARCQCLDIATLKWSDEIESVLGVDFEKILPTPVPVNEIIGAVTREAAALTGLAEGTPVVAGASDAMASMYATGMSRLGDAGESSGTSSLVFVGCDRPSAPDIPVVTKPCAIDGMPYIFDAPITSSGASLKWYLETLGEEERQTAASKGTNAYTELNEESLYVPAGSNGVLFFPYLNGERAPLWNAHARGMFIGMSLDTKHADMARAVLEGTAFALRHCIETVRAAGGKADCLRVTGGGTKSRTWSLIKASVLRMPVYLLDDVSGDVPFGDALIAGNAVGVFPDLGESIKKLIKVKEVIEPIEAWSDVYDKIYPFYVSMYQKLDLDLKDYRDLVREINGL